MYSFRKSKKGFTLIELMVVVAIIGVLALLGLRVYSGQQAKARNAVVKANAGSIQTIIQSELADKTPVAAASMVDNTSTAAGTINLIYNAHIFNPFGVANSGVTDAATGQQIKNVVAVAYDTTTATALAAALPGEVYVVQDASLVFFINGKGSDGQPVYPTVDLTARR